MAPNPGLLLSIASDLGMAPFVIHLGTSWHDSIGRVITLFPGPLPVEATSNLSLMIQPKPAAPPLPGPPPPLGSRARAGQPHAHWQRRGAHWQHEPGLASPGPRLRKPRRPARTPRIRAAHAGLSHAPTRGLCILVVSRVLNCFPRP